MTIEKFDIWLEQPEEDIQSTVDDLIGFVEELLEENEHLKRMLEAYKKDHQ